MWISESISLILYVQLDVTHVEELADGCSISELVSEAPLCNLTEGVSCMQNNRVERASPWYNLGDWL